MSGGESWGAGRGMVFQPPSASAGFREGIQFDGPPVSGPVAPELPRTSLFPRPIGPRLASRQRRASLVTTIGLAYLGQPSHGRPSQAGDSRRDTVASAQSYSEADSDRRSAPETNMRRLKNRSFAFALTLPKQWVGRIGVQESKPLRILGLNTPIKQVRKLLTVSLLSRHSAFVCQCLWQGADALV